MRPMQSNNAGFTLLELVVAMSIVIITLGIGLPTSTALLTHVNLFATRDEMITQMRLTQADAMVYNQPGIIWFAPFNQYYWRTLGSTFLNETNFYPGVAYANGYLSINARRLSYDNLGDAQIAGTIRFASGRQEADIRLFMGAGLQLETGKMS